MGSAPKENHFLEGKNQLISFAIVRIVIFFPVLPQGIGKVNARKSEESKSNGRLLIRQSTMELDRKVRFY